MIFVDVETQNFFNDAELGEKFGPSELKVSFVGAYDYEKDEYLSYWEKDLRKLEEVLKVTDRVVGYNIWGFDYGVLSSYMKAPYLGSHGGDEESDWVPTEIG